MITASELFKETLGSFQEEGLSPEAALKATRKQLLLEAQHYENQASYHERRGFFIIAEKQRDWAYELRVQAAL